MTDDPEPVEYLHWEFYLATQHELTADGASGTAPHLEVNFGAAPNLLRDCTKHGPICPQLQSPLTMVMGEPSAAEQDEACLTLSVAVPAAEAPARPVMVWLHGGAYAVGASSYEWYRPDALVRRGTVHDAEPSRGVFRGRPHLPLGACHDSALVLETRSLSARLRFGFVKVVRVVHPEMRTERRRDDSDLADLLWLRVNASATAHADPLAALVGEGNCASACRVQCA